MDNGKTHKKLPKKKEEIVINALTLSISDTSKVLMKASKSTTKDIKRSEVTNMIQ